MYRDWKELCKKGTEEEGGRPTYAEKLILVGKGVINTADLVISHK
jgi:hypothetical protein